MLFLLIVFLHISTMFAGVSLSYGGVIYFMFALRSGNVSGVRALSATAKATDRVIPVLYLVGGTFGLAAAIVSNSNLLAPWLLIAYVLFVLLAITGARFTAPSIERIGRAVASAPDGALPAEVASLSQRFYRIEVFDFLLLILIIFDMVVKPFS